MEDEDYVSNGENPCCPYCESDNLDLHDAKYSIGMEVRCLDCKAEWHEIYEMVGYEVTKMPEGWKYNIFEGMKERAKT